MREKPSEASTHWIVSQFLRILGLEGLAVAVHENLGWRRRRGLERGGRQVSWVAIG
jgi:hypothetical protein